MDYFEAPLTSMVIVFVVSRGLKVRGGRVVERVMILNKTDHRRTHEILGSGRRVQITVALATLACVPQEPCFREVTSRRTPRRDQFPGVWPPSAEI